MADASNYVLRVSAGSSYDISTHQLVPVNSDSPISISSDDLDAKLNVKINNFRGIPKEAPKTAEYFKHAPHTADLYSIAFSFRPRATINGNELVFGNDFDEPISKNLPPGFNNALRIVRWAVDPGLDGDVYAEKPYLYGPLLSSINVLRIGQKEDEKAAAEDNDDDEEDETNEAGAWHEGGSGSGATIRDEKNIPAQGSQRMKHFLTEQHRKDFEFEKGREYCCDFFNPYLDFNEFALKLPGFSLHIMKYWDGQPLRYVLKHKNADRSVDKPILVITIMLIHEDKLEEENKKWEDAHKPAATSTESTIPQSTGEKTEDRYEDEGVD